MKRVIKSLVQKLGYTISKHEEYGKDFMDIYTACKPYTMTSVQRMFSLYQAVNYVINNSIEGDFVECGVWRGGSSMLMAKTLLLRGATNRNIFLYDTFEGMSAPTAKDIDKDGNTAEALMNETQSQKDKPDSVWCLAGIEDVKANLASTGYPEKKMHYVQGKVEDTIPKTVPDKIALLRLDTDWYESTYHELTHLYPLLERAGILILDDYGHWQGARVATDQYFSEKKIPIFLNTIDDTGRIAVKSA